MLGLEVPLDQGWWFNLWGYHLMDIKSLGDDHNHLLGSGRVTKRFYAVVEYTQNHVKISSKLTNLRIKSLIKEYSVEQRSNP